MSETQATATHWNAVQIEDITLQLLRDHTACCPIDGAKLAVVMDHTTAKGGLLAAHCTYCHRNYTKSPE